MYRIELAKESFKFSCSHFTILSATVAERLHGHNYQLKFDVELAGVNPELGLAFDFNAVKPAIKAFCTALDERILLPTRSKYVTCNTQDESVTVRFQNKKYVFPQEDCLLLPLVNISSEELAFYAAREIQKSMANLPHWTGVGATIEETRGQSVRYFQSR